MIKKYIVTFFSHFGAIRFERELRARGIKGIVKPVPRTLSSSCGTCVEFGINMSLSEEFRDEKAVFYLKDNELKINDNHNEIEQVAEISKEGYRRIYTAKE
ncbi:putative Se/S carrier-like protein [Lachnoanaerobaculum gingivalis]|uniref:putative Se/S carrier-like protein n=1 Tax=Lachnoanaerobaculum gingivalis TaxID=2490855 RepID=UPI0028D61465|nr:putative Se/S carrier-like protein [Lachnoanaerobaculum gingivalis]